MRITDRSKTISRRARRAGATARLEPADIGRSRTPATTAATHPKSLVPCEMSLNGRRESHRKADDPPLPRPKPDEVPERETGAPEDGRATPPVAGGRLPGRERHGARYRVKVTPPNLLVMQVDRRKRAQNPIELCTPLPAPAVSLGKSENLSMTDDGGADSGRTVTGTQRLDSVAGPVRLASESQQQARIEKKAGHRPPLSRAAPEAPRWAHLQATLPRAP